MRRHAIGIIAVILLLAAVGLWLCPDIGERALGLQAAFFRVGALMAVLWMAYPDVRRIPAWILAVVPLLLAIVALRPRLFPYILPVILLIAVLRPRKRKSLRDNT